jgi:hypothetical protein
MKENKGQAGVSKDEIARVLAVGFQQVQRLGRALFEAQERMLPEGQKWADLDEADQSFWIDSAS